MSALGDFEPSNLNSESLSLEAKAEDLGFPESTLALEAKATAASSDRTFISYSERVRDDLDFALWPQNQACDLFRSSPSDSYPGTLGDGQALGYAQTSGIMLMAGSNDASSAAIVGALAYDTRQGVGYLVDPRARAVLSEPRAFATVSDFAGKLLVAAGENPIHDAARPAGMLRDTAEVYDPSPEHRSFEPDLLPLAVGRTRHASVTLTNGEVALLGGRAEDADASRFIEVVSPVTRVSKLLENLRIGRTSPVAIRLSDGRLLVAGGTDAAGKPVAELEWRSPDAGHLEAPYDGTVSIPARFERAYAALPGGAALALGGCEDRAGSPEEECASWCARGCPKALDGTTKQRFDAFWIGADASVTELDFSISAARPTLLPGSDGRPWLITVGVDEAGRLATDRVLAYRFDPWGKSFSASDMDLGPPDGIRTPRFVALGSDAFAWLGEDTNGSVLRGVRSGTRSRFSSDVALVGLRDAQDSRRPAHLAPDHPPSARLEYDSESGRVHFAQAERAGTSSCVWVSDAEYADFRARIEFSTATAPEIAVGSHRLSEAARTATEAGCHVPRSANGEHVILVERTGERLSVTRGDQSTDCDVGSPRVPFAVCGSELGDVDVTLIAVTRSP